MASERHLVITVHGIRTFGDWQERLEKLLKADNSAIEVFNYKYGYFSVLAFIIPFLRWLVTRRFRAELLYQIGTGAWDRVDIVAHSFGTHLVAWGLYGIESHKRPRIHTLILAGSVLKTSFPWSELVGASVERVVNECGIRDLVLVVNQFFVLFTGLAGREGFSGMTRDEFRNRYFQFGHSGCFQVKGRADDGFIVNNWLPLLLTEEKAPVFPDPRSSTPWRGFMTFLFNNAEPIKLFLWMSPLIALVLWVNGQRVEAVQQAARARINAILTLSNSDIGRRDPLTAALLMMEVPGIAADLPENEPAGVASAAQRLATRGIPETLLKFPVGDRGVIALGAGGSPILTANNDGTAWIWRSRPNDAIKVPSIMGVALISAVFSSNGTRVGTVDNQGRVVLWNAETAGHPAVVLQGARVDVSSIAFSPDAGHLVIASTNGTARVWRADGSGEPVVLRGHRGRVNYAEFSPDGARIVTASDDGTARVWRADGTGQSILLRGHREALNRAGFSPDGVRIVTASVDGTARVWRADGTGEPVVLRGHAGPVLFAGFSSDGQQVLTTSLDRTAALWSIDQPDPVLLTVLRGHRDGVVEGAFSPDGNHVLTVSRDGTAILWPRCGPPSLLSSPAYPVQRAVFSDDGKHVYTAPSSSEVLGTGMEAVVLVWRTSSLTGPIAFCGHHGEVIHGEYSPDGKRFVTASADSTARVWRADGTGEPIVLQGHRGRVNYAGFSPDGARILTVSADSTARVWPADGSGEPVVLRGHTGAVRYAEFSVDGKWIVTASADGTARVWRADGTGAPSLINAHAGRGWPGGGGVQHAAFSANGHLVLTCGAKSAKLWPAVGPDRPISVMGTDDPISVLGADTLRPVLYCAFSPDSKKVVTSRVDGKVMIWLVDPDGGSRRDTVLEGHRDPVWHAAFSPDGRKVVAASVDWTARVWRLVRDPETKLEPMVLHHDGEVNDASFDSRGAHVVTASNDGTARVWDAERASEPQNLNGHRGTVSSAVFNSDGNHVLTTSSDSTVMVWRVEWRDLLAQLRNSTTMCLTMEDRIRFLNVSLAKARSDYQKCEQNTTPAR